MRPMKKVTAWLAVERHRAYVYRVLVGVGAVAVAYGYLSEQEVATWLGVAAQVLSVAGNGLAARNTSTSKETQQ